MIEVTGKSRSLCRRRVEDRKTKNTDLVRRWLEMNRRRQNGKFRVEFVVGEVLWKDWCEKLPGGEVDPR